MSILIRGMEMPKRCLDCPFLITRDNDDCILQSDEANAKFEGWDDMKASCPLIELPPHGRLIDADKFAETLKEVSIRQGYDKLFSDNILSVGDVFDAIAADLKGEGLDKYKLAPTVIEAEGET